MINIDFTNCLFIGNPANIVLGGEIEFQVCRSISEYSQLSNRHFDCVIVEFAALKEHKATISELLQIGRDSTIQFLVRMYEEADFRELFLSFSLPIPQYLICPLKLEELKHACTIFDKPQSYQEKDKRIRELELLVLQDDLTGVKNRRYIRYFLPAIIKEARQLNFQVTLLLFDIDDFKHYNDTYGHALGDQVLRQTASLIRRCCRTQDVVARLGGDEFAVVFWDKTCCSRHLSDTGDENDRRACLNHPREAFFMAERFRHEMSTAAFDLLGIKGKGSLTISGGLASFPTDAETAETLFEKADQAMLEAKRSGKNRLYLVGGPSTV